ncbi:MAG TPA: PEP-CTERM sorting domain-containing protein [Gemmatimonadales bacterium]|nr:PEP-CTERM sorting domain-containing protein [Gemmatimonadales bacterium]
MRIQTVLAGATLLSLATFPSIAHAQLWKNGNFDGFGGLASERNGTFIDARLYDNFIASGTGWTVTSLFGEFLTDFPAGDAYWEIRTGVSAGLGGTLLYSGTNTITGVDDLGDALGFDHRLYTVSGFSPFFLAPGEYWLTIAPIGLGEGFAFVTTTEGVDGINAVGDLTAFWDSPSTGTNFGDASDQLEAFSDYSYGLNGIEGTDGTTVPEPSTVVLLATGLGAMAVAGYRRRRVG